jgi:hypothetical protein
VFSFTGEGVPVSAPLVVSDETAFVVDNLDRAGRVARAKALKEALVDPIMSRPLAPKPTAADAFLMAPPYRTQPHAPPEPESYIDEDGIEHHERLSSDYGARDDALVL